MRLIKRGDRFAKFELDGGVKVWALHDGYVDMPKTRLCQAGNRTLDTAEFPKVIPLHDEMLRLSVNCFLVSSGGDDLLIDTGASDSWHPTMGKLPEAFREAEIDSGTVTSVAFTHTHIDHINGLILPGGESAFPSLKRVLVPAAEMKMFKEEVTLERYRKQGEGAGPKFLRYFPIVQSVTDGAAIGLGIEAVAAHGHEIGHTAYKIVSGADTLLVWGDVVHVPAIQFERPELTWEFDADQDMARATRLAMFSLASRPRSFVAGAHLAFPGLGRVSQREGKHRFEPIA